MRFRPSACCRTGGLPRASDDKRSGYGMWRRGRDRPPRRAYGSGSGPLPAAGRAAGLGLFRQLRSGCGMWRPVPRPPASKGIRGRIKALCLLPDGRLASGSWDNTIRLWDVTTGAETTRLEGHTSAVQALCLLPDGRLASGSRDNTIRLWDVTRSTEIARLEIDAPVARSSRSAQSPRRRRRRGPPALAGDLGLSSLAALLAPSNLARDVDIVLCKIEIMAMIVGHGELDLTTRTARLRRGSLRKIFWQDRRTCPCNLGLEGPEFFVPNACNPLKRLKTKK